MKTLALVAVALLFSGPIALAGQETLWTGTRPNDYFDLLLLKESTERWVAIVGLIVAGVLAVVVYARTSHVRVGDREEDRGRVQRDQAALRSWISIPRARCSRRISDCRISRTSSRRSPKDRRHYGHRSESRKARKDPRKAPDFVWTIRLRQPLAGEDERQAKLVPCFPYDPVLSVIQRLCSKSRRCRCH
jgi:hypothetical protein